MYLRTLLTLFVSLFISVYTIATPPCIPSFITSINGQGDTVCVGVPVDFTNTSDVAGEPLVFKQWNFGDATTSNLENPTHTFNQSGTFVVTFNLASASCTGMVFKDTIYVIPAPTIQRWGFDPKCFEACDGKAYIFITGVHNDYQITWDDPNFQDADSAIGLCAGTYTATLTDLYGCESVSAPLTLTDPDELIVDAGPDIFICVGDNPYTMQTSISGGTPPYNDFDWEPFWGLNDPSLQNPVLDPVDESIYGQYFFSLYDDNGCPASDPVSVEMTPATINGHITDAAGSAVVAGEVVLIKKDTPGLPWMILDTYTLIPGAGGYYEFLNVPLTDVYILARPDINTNANLVATYYSVFDGDEGEFEIDSATYISLDCGQTYTEDIIMIQEADINGTCTLEGYVYWATGKKESEDPIPLIDVVVKKTPPGNAVSYTQTDASGYFRFDSLDAGMTYSFIVTIPGLGMDTNYYIEIELSDSLFTDLNFYVDTMPGTAGIYVTNPSGINALEYTHKEMVAYPNPFTDQCELVFPNEVSGTFSFSLFDLAGKLVKKVDDLNGKQYLLKTEDLEQGIYFAEVRTADAVFRTRVMKK